MTRLRTGITTGSCAAAAAKAAAQILCGRQVGGQIDIPLPDGERLNVPILYARKQDDCVVAAVRKDAGDDPDVTDGMEILATVRFCVGDGIEFIAGDGVGTVTKPGLQLSPGQAAINPIPRKIIIESLREVTERGLVVEISIPGGRQVAEKTFNPRLGIVGGLSILGTSGIVRPYCRRAQRDAISCAMDVACACKIDALILVPGNIGAKAAGKLFNPQPEQVIEVGNEWGLALDCLAGRSFRNVMILGHPGKLCKMIAGQWDTHSSRSDSALEIVRKVAGETIGVCPSDSKTAEGVFAELDSAQADKLAAELARRIAAAVGEKIGDQMPLTICLVNMAGSMLGTFGDITPWK